MTRERERERESESECEREGKVGRYVLRPDVRSDFNS